MVRLENMEFYAYHGVLESERLEGNRFCVDFEYEYDMAAAAASDSIDDAVNYAIIYDIVKEQMTIPSNLLEHVAGRILGAVRRRFPQLEHASVTVSKYNPPVGGKCSRSSVTMKF